MRKSITALTTSLFDCQGKDTQLLRTAEVRTILRYAKKYIYTYTYSPYVRAGFDIWWKLNIPLRQTFISHVKSTKFFYVKNFRNSVSHVQLGLIIFSCCGQEHLNKGNVFSPALNPVTAQGHPCRSWSKKAETLSPGISWTAAIPYSNKGRTTLMERKKSVAVENTFFL